MLESMRSHAQSWIAKVILGGIILSFGLWGVGDYFMGSHVEYVAEIDGTPVTDVAFQNAYERQLNSYRNMLGKQFSKTLADQIGVKDETLQTLINRQLLLEEAGKMGLTAPEGELAATIQSNPAFQSAAGFDANRYRLLTRNMGYANPRDFENELRMSIMVDALQRALINSAHVSEAEVRASFDRAYEQRVLTAVVVNPDSLLKNINISDEQARSYYEEHSNRYQSPMKVKLVAVEIAPQALAADTVVDDADIQTAYEERAAEFSTPEERRASHILARIKDSNNAEEKAAARKKIEAAKARLDAGEDFAKIAKAMSDDTTAAKGGDLSYFRRGTMVPAFDEAVFAMKKGETSGIIETQFGYHIIHLADIKPAAVKSLAEVHDQLAESLRMEKAKEEAYKLSEDLDNALGMEGSLLAAAKNINLKAMEIGPISASETLGNAFLASDSSLRRLAFSTMPGDAVNIHELDDGRFVALEVLDRIEPTTLPFAEVAASAYADAKQDQADQQARELAQTMLTEAGSKSADQLAQKYGQAKYVSKPVRRDGTGDSNDWLTGNILNEAFTLNQGGWLSAPQQVNKGYAVVQVQDVIAADDELYSKQHDQLREETLKKKGGIRFARWMASVRDRHEIVIHDKVLAHF